MTPMELAPKREQIGILSLKFPAGFETGKSSVSTVLRISFPLDQGEAVRTTLVL
jgi:hypothetical protein